MQSIQLTQEQKDKLLEMCKSLFPEYDFRLSRPIFKCPDTTFIQLGKNNSNKYTIEIHWFEFCMTYLVDKIYYPDGNGKRDTQNKVKHFFFQTFIDTIEGATSGYDHPIDYLYKEFKKLNNSLT